VPAGRGGETPLRERLGVSGLAMKARVLKNKIEIVDLLPFPVIVSKRSPYVARITKTTVFVYSPIYKSMPIPIPIEN
jgi:hypothetical protein